jgi:hypothetical protein
MAGLVGTPLRPGTFVTVDAVFAGVGVCALATLRIRSGSQLSREQSRRRVSDLSRTPTASPPEAFSYFSDTRRVVEM